MICNNPNCGASTGIHGGMTFGSGRLDDHGYFEKPCRLCAEDFDSKVAQIREDIRQDGLKMGETPEDIEEYLNTAQWLNMPAWPFAEKGTINELT
jgi:hypothetical protein